MTFDIYDKERVRRKFNKISLDSIMNLVRLILVYVIWSISFNIQLELNFLFQKISDEINLKSVYSGFF